MIRLKGMKIVIQRVLNAKLTIDSKLISSISKGEVLLVSFTNDDNKLVVDKMIDKLLKLRMFEDENGKTNLSIDSFNGEILAVSQFTLYANLAKGNRPSFENCLRSDLAKELYAYFADELVKKYPHTKFGVFQEDMKIDLVNDGPFTLILDSKELKYNG